MDSEPESWLIVYRGYRNVTKPLRLGGRAVVCQTSARGYAVHAREGSRLSNGGGQRPLACGEGRIVMPCVELACEWHKVTSKYKCYERRKKWCWSRCARKLKVTPPGGTLKNVVTPYIEREIERWGYMVPREKSVRKARKADFWVGANVRTCWN